MNKKNAHKAKRNLARKLGAKELKKGVGVFQTDAWQKRKDAIIARVEKKNAKAQSRKNANKKLS